MNIIIYDSNSIETMQLRTIIKEYSNNYNTIIKERTYFDINDILKIKEDFDICFINLKTYLNNKKELENWRINKTIKFVYLSNNTLELLECLQNNPNDYFILKPFDDNKVITILNTIKENIKEKCIFVKIPNNGQQRINITDLNYVNIEARSLQYHLQDKNITSQTLRTSFLVAIQPYLIHKELYFISPSLLLNLTNIETLYNNHIVFKNGDILYYPKIAYTDLLSAWKNYMI